MRIVGLPFGDSFFHTAPARTGAGMKEIIMQLGTKEHEDIVAAFERAFPYGRKDKEPKDLWKNGNVYQNGEYNQLFLAFRHGIAYAQCIERLNQL